MKIIGISGLAGSGKSSFAEVLVDMGYTRKSFAEPIKWIARRYFFWDGEKDLRGRLLLQTLGTEVGRAYDKDVWVKHMEEYINNRLKMEQVAKYKEEVKVVIDDARFDNEAKFIRDLGGKIIFLKGKKYDMGNLESHESEQLPPPDLNDIVLEFPDMGSKEKFQEKVREELKNLGIE